MGWGAVGVLLGRLLPWVDILWEEVLGDDKSVFASKATAVDSRITNPGSEEDEGPASRPGSDLGADWNPVVRSIGAFIGIAFAIVSNHIPIYTKAVDFPLTLIKAQTPMAIHIPGLFNFSPGQPGSMVPSRSFETWIHPFHARRSRRHSHCIRFQPRNSAFTGYSLASSRVGKRLL